MTQAIAAQSVVDKEVQKFASEPRKSLNEPAEIHDEAHSELLQDPESTRMVPGSSLKEEGVGRGRKIFQGKLLAAEEMASNSNLIAEEEQPTHTVAEMKQVEDITSLVDASLSSSDAVPGCINETTKIKQATKTEHTKAFEKTVKIHASVDFSTGMTRSLLPPMSKMSFGNASEKRKVHGDVNNFWGVAESSLMQLLERGTTSCIALRQASYAHAHDHTSTSTHI